MRILLRSACAGLMTVVILAALSNDAFAKPKNGNKSRAIEPITRYYERAVRDIAGRQASPARSFYVYTQMSGH